MRPPLKYSSQQIGIGLREWQFVPSQGQGGVMPYDCITCGLLPQDDHDGRDGTPCSFDCIMA